MSEQTGKRRMAAVLAADVAGYSRLMGEGEEATIAALGRARAVFREHVGGHDGRVVDTAGDSVLSVFESVIEAVRAALAVQETLAARNADVPEDRRMQFRIGVHFGDIVEQDDGTIYGDGVNIAARLEGLAEPGGLTVSGTVHEHIEGKLGVGLADLGEQEVKNIARPVRAWRVAAGGAPAPAAPARSLKRHGFAAAAAALVVVIGGAAWQLMQGEDQAPAVDAILAVPDGPAIAVLPFVNEGGDPEQDYFATGLTEGLINSLSRFRELRVIARNTTAHYASQGVDAATLHRELGARYVVEGGVRRDGDTVRVMVELSDAGDGTHLWGETYDRDLTAASVFDIQDDVVNRVAATIGDLQGIAMRAALRSVGDKPPEELASVECWLRMARYYDGISPAEHAVIRTCAERAVTEDPSYSGGWQALAWVSLDEHRFNLDPRPGSLDRALEAAKQAVSSDPHSAAAHNVLGAVHYVMGNIESFRIEAEKALSLNPNEAEILAATGINLVHSGEDERGIAMMKKAIALNPRHPSWYHFAFFHYHYRRGAYEDALAAVLNANWVGALWYHAQAVAAYGQLGRLEEAAEEVDKLLAIDPDFADNYWDEIDKWSFREDHAQMFIDGFRKAGLEVPDRPEPTD
jgi:adenylate cyclase